MEWGRAPRTENVIFFGMVSLADPFLPPLMMRVQVYNMILIILCTVQAVKARKIPENFNEAKYDGGDFSKLSLQVFVKEDAMVGWLRMTSDVAGISGSLCTPPA